MSTWAFNGQKALVCGASQGIGEATARLLAERGAQVTLVARQKEKLQKILNELPGQGHQVLALDLSNSEALQAQASVIAQTGATILVNNAGGPKGGPLLEASEQEFEQAFRTHVLSAQFLSKTLLPAMKSQKSGRIINVISTSVKAPIPNLGVSNTIRAAMGNWAKTLSQELGPVGVTVNNVLPGYTQTPRFEALRSATAQKLQISEAQVEAQWKASIPLARFAQAREVAEAIAFLASPAASYISGINLPVDGGRTPSL